jgi:competence protein ComEA
MKLPNLMVLCLLLVGGLGQYSVNAMANMPAFSGNLQLLKTQDNASSTIDINKANAEELASLPGIGTKKAIAIVEYRELNGKFVSVEELVNVKGIGPKMLAKLNGFISV